jgi:Carboxypeptidase regulatory-like domain/TonB dependent receptor
LDSMRFSKSAIKKLSCGIAATIVCLNIAAGTALAQSVLSSITGTITDPSGHVVPAATIIAHETATGVDQKTTSNEAGIYALVDLLPGTYVVTVSAPGFQDDRSTPIILISAQSSKFDAPLRVGNATTTIEVDSTPPTMNSENAELGELVTGQDARRDAISRSIFALLAINPTTVGDGSTSMIGGQRANYSTFTIDGVTTMNNIYGSTSGGMTADQAFESIAELKVTDSNGAADTAGFNTVITTTKSGTNNLHGSTFYTTDNSALNATPFYSATKSKGPALQWYGLSVGGPVLVPKVYNGHGKTFFFVTWEHRTFPLAAGNAYLSNTTLPSANFEAGNFSQLLTASTPIQIFNPANGLAFPDNTINIPMSSVATALETDYYPTAPSLFATGDYQFLRATPEHINREDYKIDHHFSGKDIISGRYTRQYDPEPQNFDSGTDILGHSKIATYNNTYLSYTHTFSPNLVNEIRLSFAKDERDYEPFHNADQVLAKIGLQGISVPPSLQGFPQVYFGSSGIEQLSESPSQTAVSYDYPLLDNLNWQRGHHSIKFGVAFTDTRPYSGNGNGTQQLGQYNFNGFATANSAVPHSGYDYADFLLGIPSSVSLNENPPNRYNRSLNSAWYVQDAWTVSPKVTVTAGLRWDYFQPPVDANDRRANFDPNYSNNGYLGGIVLPDQKAVKLLNPGLPTIITNNLIEVAPAGFPGRSMLYGNKGNFGPRLGVAYMIDPRTVVRGGWGMYYAQLINSVQDDLAGGGVFGTSLVAYNTITNGTPAFAWPNAFGSVSVNGNLNCTSQCLSVEGVDPHLKEPVSQEYNLTIERDLGHQIVGRLAYRGYKTYNLPYIVDLSIPRAGSNGNAASNYTLSLFPLYNPVHWVESGAIQNQNGLEAETAKKFSNGVTFQLAYALTKNLTDDVAGGGGDGESDSPQNPYNLRADYGNSRPIPRNRLTGNVVYDLPFGKGRQFASSVPAVVDYVIGGWQTSGLMMWQTGNFLTPYYSGSQVPDGLGDGKTVQQNIRADGVNLRPNCNSGFGVASAGQYPKMWFNPAAFSLPNVGQYGTCGTGVIQGPGAWSANIGAHKSIPMGEKAQLRFDANMMNVFNHPNLGSPQLNLSNTNAQGGFGQIYESTQSGAEELNPTVTSVDGERHIWLGMRVDF